MRVSGWKTWLVATAGVPLLAVGGMAGFSLRADGPPSNVATKNGKGSVRVIVILKDQHHRVPVFSPARARMLQLDQAPITRELLGTGALNVKTFSTINAVAAAVSRAEAALLATNPAVAEVVPDAVIRAPAHSSNRSARSANSQAPGASAATAGSSAPAGACPTDPARPLLEPEALQVTRAESDDPASASAHALGIDGNGVKVAFLADGADATVQDFQRSDGSWVFTDYRDFSGDGTKAATGGGEAMGDASAIAAQGRVTYDLSDFVNHAHPLPKGCTIRIKGMAPGASLVGLKVFAQNNTTTESGILQAIDYAVHVDHVDVINESFGSNPFPDTTQDATRLFNNMATEAGVTVVVSSGDAGITSTIGSPGSDPAVIDVGATTTWRSYAQATYGAFQFGRGGWVNNNISSLSSGGFAQNGRTIDLVAPGDLGWALCSTDVKVYTDCTDNNSPPRPSRIQLFGGTSQSAPLTAGAAALVIQAYRNTHAGASPAPALVKQILTSSAADLGHPATKQGAGLLDALQAVRTARSIQDSKGTPQADGNGVLVTPNQLNAVGNPGTRTSFQVKVTNTGAATQSMDMHGRALTTQVSQQTGSANLDTSSPRHFDNWVGVPDVYTKANFTVTAGADRLDFAADYQGDPQKTLAARVRFALFDPSGAEAGYSLPQGIGNYGHVGVRNPAAGSWMVVFFTTAGTSGTSSPIQWQATTSRYGPFATISPATLTLAPGTSSTITVEFTMPAQPGDTAASIVLAGPSIQPIAIPVTVRSVVPVGSTGATWTDVVTGGNGRAVSIPAGVSQTNTYFFDVPAQQKDIDLSITLSKDPNDQLFAYLIDPNNQTAAFATNFSMDASGKPRGGLVAQMYRRDPAPGRWALVLQWANPVSGKELQQSFTGRIRFNQVSVAAPQLPNDKAVVLPTGIPSTVSVIVHNTGAAAGAFVADGRLTDLVDLTLLPQTKATDLPLPLPASAPLPTFLVPTEIDTANASAQADVPVTFDFGPIVGDPDIAGTSKGTTAVGQFGAPEVTPGLWFVTPAEIGPFGAGGGSSGKGSVQLAAHGQSFDSALAASTGDIWLRSIDPHAKVAPASIPPGGTATITVTITPTGTKGQVVRGVLYIDNITELSAAGPGAPGGSELIGLPYSYTIG